MHNEWQVWQLEIEYTGKFSNVLLELRRPAEVKMFEQISALKEINQAHQRPL
jgi:hypothetical protein